MTPEFKDKWLRALRSGEFAQARFVPKNTRGGFCCLGVALQLIDPNGWNPVAAMVEPDDNHPKTNGYGWGGWGPGEIRNIASKLEIPIGTTRLLADMNDGFERKRSDFDQIADFIEENIAATSPVSEPCSETTTEGKT